MEFLIVGIFILGYLAITLEHTTQIDKLAPALLMMALAWACIAFGIDGFQHWFDPGHNQLMDGTNGTLNFATMGSEAKHHLLSETLLHHFGKTCEILIFLIGAMTIVEIIDHFDGFSTIRKFIKTNNRKTLLWIMAGLAFILSAIIDNLTATIVLITILRKLLSKNGHRIWYAGVIIIAANAGGAWSPIGDVTTTMLWMGGKVTTFKLLEYLFIPSLVCMVIPTFIASFLPAFKGEFYEAKDEREPNPKGPLMLYIGLALIVFVPIFKTITHLPPYVGMLLSLSVMVFLAEIISARSFTIHNIDTVEGGHGTSATFKALSKIEMPSILFFLGILMTVAALESLGLVFMFGQTVQAHMDNNLFVMLLGISSAIIDNVPLVAASMGMFDMATFAQDSPIWHLIAYATGTGGSMLVIGSAAGVVAMGMERISFFWYLKNMAWLALIGYFAGAAVYAVLVL
jgi:Na+/H+ antiporter NhaD/arsenite permease-like protein